MGGVDYGIFRLINGSSNAFAPVMWFFSSATNLWWFKLLLLVWIGYMIWRGGAFRTTIIAGIVSVGLANLGTDTFKRALPMLRPFKDPEFADQVILRIGHKTDQVGFGTASAHSANMAALAAALWIGLGWRWGLPVAFVALFTGLSRIYNGVHYPSQVALGWLTGIAAAFLIATVVRFIQKRKSEPEITA